MGAPSVLIPYPYAAQDHQTYNAKSFEDAKAGILLPDDHSYLGAMEAAMERGLRIGKDISFAGYDGILLTQMTRPKLTTVMQDTEAIGKEAARRLIECIEKPNTAGSEPVTIPCKLIRGETVGRLET